MAGWVLYDDFSSGAIDTQRWSVDDSSATITVENERAKFVHQIDHAEDSAYMRFEQSPASILGIKADVLIESCDGDVMASLSGYSGKIEDDHVTSGLKVQPGTGKQRIYATADLEAPDYTLLQKLHYAQFQRPIIDMIGVTFNLALVFSSDKITYEVDGLGKIVYKYATAVAPATNDFKALRTRSSNGEGPCTVYFDNVYVLRP
jgi:hypothetical protein